MVRLACCLSSAGIYRPPRLLVRPGTLNYVYKPGGDMIVTLPFLTPRTNPSIYAWALKLIGVK